MRKTTWAAIVGGLAATAGGVGAVDNLPQMLGADALKLVTIDVIASCNSTVQAQIKYAGTGSSAGQGELVSGRQGIAPMTRAMNSGVCGSTKTAAEGLVIGIDGVDMVADQNKACTGIEHAGADGVVTNDWRATLRMVYAGMGPSGSDIMTRDCNSAARHALLDNWDAIFREDCSSSSCQADTHPNYPGITPNVYDASDGIKEPGLRHAFRLDESSGTTDIFLDLLRLPPIIFDKTSGAEFFENRPYAVNSQQCSATERAQDDAFRVLSNSIFCNAHRPTDTYPPTFVPANTLTGEVASFIPEIQDLGFSPCAGGNFVCPEDGGTAVHLPGWDNDNNAATPPRWVVPNPSRYFPEFQDQDPIRRKCVGTNEQSKLVAGTPTAIVLPTEQVCSADGRLGVVLAINPPPLDQSVSYPTTECKSGKSDFGRAVTSSIGTGLRCSNGDKPVGAPPQCRVPQAADNSFNCLNRGGLWTATSFTGVGGPGTLDDKALAIPTKPAGCANDISVGAPGGTPTGTRPRSNIDGRVYNQVLRAGGAAGTLGAGFPITISRLISASYAIQVPLIGSFYRIHSNRTLLNGTNAGNTPVDKICTKADATRQIGCLVQASPCSLGFAAGEAADENSGTKNLQLNGVSPTLANLQNVAVHGYAAYPMARRLYVNSLRGFDNPLLAPLTNPAHVPPAESCIVAGGGACTVAIPSVNPTNCDLDSTTPLPTCCCDDSQAPGTGSDAESELVSCFQAALPGTILSNRGFFPLPGNVEVCEDFNEAAVCAATTTNSDACAGNTLIPAGSCSNGLKDGAETDMDCGGVTCSKCAAGLTCSLATDCMSGTCAVILNSPPGTRKTCQP